MRLWRTNPDLPVSSAIDLAEKYKDLGWRRLRQSEQRRIRANADEACQTSVASAHQPLALILRIEAPVRKFTKPLPSRGKNVLRERIRAAHRAFRGNATSQNG
jgi:hypothetical protein